MDRDKSNALLDVPIVIPQRENDSSESKDTEDIAEMESDGLRVGRVVDYEMVNYPLNKVVVRI